MAAKRHCIDLQTAFRPGNGANFQQNFQVQNFQVQNFQVQNFQVRDAPSRSRQPPGTMTSRVRHRGIAGAPPSLVEK
jgi:hypothetical protein